ncbi:MAG: LacI family DNA-binding transcriptional regulator [Caldilineaceae bacterium]
MSHRATLKDVAARAGVSYQTVSKVLNGQASVTAETESMIRKAVDDLGYRTNVLARNLRKQASHLIGYSWTPNSPDRANPVLDQFLASTVEAAEAAGYHILLFPTQNVASEGPAGVYVETYHDLIRMGRVDGFILTGTNYDDPRIPLLQELNFPFVAFGRANPDWRFPYVDVDGRAGTRLATEHLLAQGHQKVALLGWPEPSRAGTARANGYLEAMQTTGIAAPPEWILRGAGEVAVGVELTQQLLALPEAIRPTAVVTVDDSLAIGAMQAAQQAGLTVGRDFGVTGFDDTPGIQHLSPPLTSVRQPLRQVGTAIVELLIALMQGKEKESQQINLPPRLIVRQSSLRAQD